MKARRTFPELWWVIGVAVWLVTGAGCGSINVEGEPAVGTSVSGEQSQSTPVVLAPAVPEERLLVLEWPGMLRQGDGDLVRLSLELDPEGQLTPQAILGDEYKLRGEPVIIPNVYDTHTVLAEARLDLAGVEVAPSGTVSEALLPGQPVTFYWSIRASEVGDYRGTVWLHLRFIPEEPAGQESRIALSAQLISLKVVNFLGLGGTPVRILGGAGAFLGSAISLDSILPWVWKRLRRPRPTLSKKS